MLNEKMNLLRSILIFALLPVTHLAFSQLGGSSSHQYLNIPHNAKTAALGGILVSTADENVGTIGQNPASLNSQMYHEIQFSESFYIPGVKYSSLNYAAKSNALGDYGIGIQNLSYEKMDRTDETGVGQGIFYGNETAIYLTKAHTIGNYTIGVNAKYAQSLIERFFSFGLMTDVGVTFKHPERDLTIGMVVRNAGVQFKRYNSTNNSPLPFQVNAGITFKPEHMPLKMTITLRDLQRFNITYLDPTPVCPDFTCDTLIVPTSTLGDKVLRHLNFAGELKLSRTMAFRLGYSFMRRKELKLNRSGGAGFSWGLRVKTRKMTIEYGKIFYQFAGRPDYISISMNTDQIFGRRRKQDLDLVRR